VILAAELEVHVAAERQHIAWSKAPEDLERRWGQRLEEPPEEGRITVSLA
jgi:hypothetical protein